MTTRGRRNKPSPKLSHIDAAGRARMVDVGAKPASERVAIAGATIRMSPATLNLIRKGRIAKGEVLAVARVAGIMAAKRTSEFVPLCHPLTLDVVAVDFTPRVGGRLEVRATAKLTGKTGVEMEALVAVAAAALTVYDMCKAVDRGMEITDVCLLEKRGGRSGTWKRIEKRGGGA
jgi:cyclic pyranopterin phosphate synthase